MFGMRSKLGLILICHFQLHTQRLGGTCIHVNESTSSAQKGETLGDTVRSMGCYCDAIGQSVSQLVGRCVLVAKL